MRAFEVFFLEEWDVSFKHFWSNEGTNNVVDGIANDGSDAEEDEEEYDIEGCVGVNSGERASSEEEGVAGEKWCYDETCFTEDDQEEDEVGPEAIVFYDINEVFVYVEEKFKEATDELHDVTLYDGGRQCNAVVL